MQVQEVIEARDRQLAKRVADKVMTPEAMEQAEADVLAQVNGQLYKPVKLGPSSIKKQRRGGRTFLEEFDDELRSLAPEMKARIINVKKSDWYKKAIGDTKLFPRQMPLYPSEDPKRKFWIVARGQDTQGKAAPTCNSCGRELALSEVKANAYAGHWCSVPHNKQPEDRLKDGMA